MLQQQPYQTNVPSTCYAYSRHDCNRSGCVPSEHSDVEHPKLVCRPTAAAAATASARDNDDL